MSIVVADDENTNQGLSEYLAWRESIVPLKRPRRKRTAETDWLRRHISPIIYGQKSADGTPKPVFSEKQLLQRRSMGWALGEQIPLWKLNKHLANEMTAYFQGDGDETNAETMAMIDIDNHSSGTLAGAWAFSAEVDKHLEGVQWETSTNGDGLHGYILISKLGERAETVNKAIAELQAKLKALLQTGNFDVELVEVKGKCPDLEWESRRLVGIHFGTLAKIPRTLRIEQMEAMGKISLRDIRSLKIEQTIKLPQRKASKGSCDYDVINSKYVENIEWLREQATAFLENREIKCYGRNVVTPEDLVCYWIIGSWLKDHANGDGSSPKRCWAALWNGLKAGGHTDRGWNHHRWKAIRDFFSAYGHTDWENHRYSVRTDDEKGVACKWEVSKEIYEFVLYRQGGGLFGDTNSKGMTLLYGNGENLRPERVMWSLERFIRQAHWLVDDYTMAA